MAYTVIWYKEDQEVGRTPFEGAMQAKNHANEMFPARQTTFDATHYEVVDEDGRVIASHARKP